MSCRIRFWIVLLAALLVPIALCSWTLEGARWVLTGRGGARRPVATA